MSNNKETEDNYVYHINPDDLSPYDCSDYDVIDLSNMNTSSVSSVGIYTTNTSGTNVNDLYGYFVTNNTNHINVTIPNHNHSVDTFYFPDTTFVEKKEFENCMPEITVLHEMSEMYPGFKKAFDNFKTTYSLVKEEYEIQKRALK